MKFLILVLVWGGLFGEALPRKVIALYDSKAETDVYYTKPRQFAEMPCNHLGLVFEYRDIRKPLPELGKDVVGVLAYFTSDTKLTYEEGFDYLTWAIQVLKQGKKFVVMGSPLLLPGDLHIPLSSVNEFWELLGGRLTEEWIDQTSSIELVKTEPDLTEFEMGYRKPYPSFPELIATNKNVRSVVSAETINGVTTLVGISPNGGWSMDGYAAWSVFENDVEKRSWTINPFIWFKEVFGTETLPKPDTTTMGGRRIYYSQLDGDGWNNETENPGFPYGTISQKVLLEKIYKKYPELPVTIAPIGADISLEWVALPKSREVAVDCFALPHVEVGSHTFTHPFDWDFFVDYQPQDELPFLHLYPSGSWLGRGFFARIRGWFTKETGIYSGDGTMQRERGHTFDDAYDVPRAFALQPFNLELEVEGSVDLINSLSPGKPVELYQWSGNCRPFLQIMEAVAAIDLPNINGGDTRFDAEYDSYAWVAPLGRDVGGYRQVYSSNANENLYTALWTKNFFGYNLLPQTFENTERPIRIRPMNLYYHSYSGQKVPSLEALEQNIAYILKQEYIPIHASVFSNLVNGFYSAEIEKIGELKWRISNHGSLPTMRFDDASLLSVDLGSSKGIIGQRHFQGSLYVYCDRTLPVWEIALRQKPGVGMYLIQSSWVIYDLKKEGQSVSFSTEGFGLGEMEWKVPSDGKFRISWKDHAYETESENGILKIRIDDSGIDPMVMRIEAGI